MDFRVNLNGMTISEDSGYKDYMWAVGLNRYALELIGLWPKTDGIIKANFSSDIRVGIVFISMTFFSIIPYMWSLIRVWGDMILMVDNLQITLTLMIASLKIAVMRWKRKAFFSIVKMIEEDWIKSKMNAERDVMLRRAHTTRQIIICQYIIVALSIPVMMIFPYFGLQFRTTTNLTDGERILPLQAYYFYNTDKSPQFELTFAVQLITMYMCQMSYVSVDAFFGLVIFHACGQLENFRHRLYELILCKDFAITLHNNVKNHLRLIRFSKTVEDMFTMIMLSLFIYFGIVFCLFGFILLTMIADVTAITFQRMFFTILCITSLLAHAFLYCGAGEMIAEQCEALHRAIYELDWYNLESRKAKTFVLLMVQAKEPLRITAGKIFPLTITTFCNLLKTSTGYISFLLAIRS